MNWRKKKSSNIRSRIFRNITYLVYPRSQVAAWKTHGGEIWAFYGCRMKNLAFVWTWLELWHSSPGTLQHLFQFSLGCSGLRQTDSRHNPNHPLSCTERGVNWMRWGAIFVSDFLSVLICELRFANHIWDSGKNIFLCFPVNSSWITFSRENVIRESFTAGHTLYIKRRRAKNMTAG